MAARRKLRTVSDVISRLRWDAADDDKLHESVFFVLRLLRLLLGLRRCWSRRRLQRARRWWRRRQWRQ